MESTAKKQCNILVDVLIAHGIRHFVMSPGSRNAPIIVALARRDGIERHVVVDERSAAFIALGLAHETGRNLVCRLLLEKKKNKKKKKLVFLLLLAHQKDTNMECRRLRRKKTEKSDQQRRMKKMTSVREQTQH